MDLKDFADRAWAVLLAHSPSKSKKVLRMKLCKECVFLSDATCTHDSGRDPVNGSAQMSAAHNRFEGPCGMEARYWKPKDIAYPGGPSE